MDSLHFSVTGLFMFYMIISANFFVPLLSCRAQHMIADSMLVRHGLGLLTMIFFVVYANIKEKLSFRTIVGMSAALYAWFIISTKMNLTAWKFLFFLLGAYYIIYMYEQNKLDTETPEEKKRIERVKKFLFGLSIATTLIGATLYIGEKKIEYGGNFNWITFFLGTPACRRKSPEVGVLSALKAVAK